MSSREQMIALLRSHLEEIVPGEAQALSIDADLRDELDLDSMDVLQLVRALHAKLGVDIPESDYAKLRSLAELGAYLAERAK